MRLIKMFGITAIAAVAAMAFVGASSATANGPTALCKVHQEPCASTNLVKSIHMVSTNAILLAELLGVHLEVFCKESLGTGTVGALAKPQVVTVTSLTWTDCKELLGVKNCIVKTTKLGTFDVLRTALNVGTAQSLGNEVLVECEESLHCVYGGTPTFQLNGALNPGPGHGQFIANKLAVTKVGGFFCPSSATWTANYEPLEHIYVMT